jgi:hypothetical protein
MTDPKSPKRRAAKRARPTAADPKLPGGSAMRSAAADGPDGRDTTDPERSGALALAAAEAAAEAAVDENMWYGRGGAERALERAMAAGAEAAAASQRALERMRAALAEAAAALEAESRYRGKD